MLGSAMWPFLYKGPDSLRDNMLLVKSATQLFFFTIPTAPLHLPVKSIPWFNVLDFFYHEMKLLQQIITASYQVMKKFEIQSNQLATWAIKIMSHIRLFPEADL